jgi:hypothetical protein
LVLPMKKAELNEVFRRLQAATRGGTHALTADELEGLRTRMLPELVDGRTDEDPDDEGDRLW